MRMMTACAAILALSATAAVAQQKPAAMQVTPPAKTTAPAAAPAAGANVSATTGFRAGLPVQDAQGAAIGTIADVIKTPDGATTYKVTVDGRNVNLPGSALTLNPTGAAAISTMSKAQITASTAPPT
ncbi:hypothetical protein [uncultured Phenylobacterium sp.]|uniref:hypothetical protein n=1 Tax=uncultured Phenylobacterium sp. TaxID=349273 RepID=UPI0025E29B39|nr:hypothetical protein [uncultured Phenylobacterium sp.]